MTQYLVPEQPEARKKGGCASPTPTRFIYSGSIHYMAVVKVEVVCRDKALLHTSFDVTAAQQGDDVAEPGPGRRLAFCSRAYAY